MDLGYGSRQTRSSEQAVLRRADSFGKIIRHGPNRGGDYQGNRALYLLAVGRMGRDPASPAGQWRVIPKPEINSCFKCDIAPGAGLIDSVAKGSDGDRQVDGERSANRFVPDGIIGTS